MSRYIDADALIQDIKEHAESYFAEDFAHEWVDKQKTADVRENVHGEWIDALSQDENVKRYACSICNYHVLHRKENFCPYCGADMRKPLIWHEKLKEYGNEIVKGLQAGILKGEKE